MQQFLSNIYSTITNEEEIFQNDYNSLKIVEPSLSDFDGYDSIKNYLSIVEKLIFILISINLIVMLILYRSDLNFFFRNKTGLLIFALQIVNILKTTPYVHST